MNGMPARVQLLRVLQHRVAAVGRDDADRQMSVARRHRGQVRRLHRPGWKAVIWLLSGSVMMIACAV